VPAGRAALACHYEASGADGPAITLLHDDEVVASVTLDVAVPVFLAARRYGFVLGPRPRFSRL